MRIATYNINDIRKRIEPLRAWLDVTQPDVVCLQELKCTEAQFPFAEVEAMGYQAVVSGQKSWNGVAILARGEAPILIRKQLPGDADDAQARYIEAAVGGHVVGCCYMPNGNPQPGPKFQYKLEWFERFNSHAGSLMESGHPVVLAGDFNVVPTDADIYATRSFKDNALLQPAPRAAYQSLLSAGWTDALHRQSPTEPLFTFWSYLRNRWPRDAGLRIDHLLLSPEPARRMRRAGVDRAVRGLEGASDHAPAWVELKALRGQR
ncbi:MAG: exodeoxyribonuclease III [Variovorax sp.]|nr:MAG: exodeoxyribonuclease III [Variovorax sp.]